MNFICSKGFHKWAQISAHERECKKCSAYQCFDIFEGGDKRWQYRKRPAKWNNTRGKHDFEQCDKMVQTICRSASESSATSRPERTGIASGTPDESAVFHEWHWHATGAGMGWICYKCDGYHRFTTDENTPPEVGCISKPNPALSSPEGGTTEG